MIRKFSVVLPLRGQRELDSDDTAIRLSVDGHGDARHHRFPENHMRFKSRAVTPTGTLLVVGLVGGLVATVAATAEAQTTNLTWKGHNWKITSGGMAGVCQGSPSNVSVDNNGYLHMRITNSGGAWTAAELFTTERLGFGTYQWQIDAPIDRLDQNVVVGLFPYGPNGPRTNEIDIEYSFWGHPTGVNGDWTDYPASGTTIGEMSYKFSLNGTFSTSRFIWRTDSIANFLLSGFEPVGSTAGLINSWTYMPPNPTTNIPQQALPLGMNLWCFDAPPSNGQNVEIIVRDFQFVPEGSVSVPDGGIGTGGSTGAGGATSSGGTGGSAGRGGATGTGGVTGSGGSAGKGGATGADGAVGTGGATAVGTAGTAGATDSGSSGAAGAGSNAGATTDHGNPNRGCSCNVTRDGAASRGPLPWLVAVLFVLGRRSRRRRPGSAG